MMHEIANYRCKLKIKTSWIHQEQIPAQICMYMASIIILGCDNPFAVP